MRTQATDWKKTFAKYTSDKDRLSKIYKQLLKLNNKKINNLTLKWVKDLKHTPHQQKYKVPNKHMKKRSTSYIIREIRIKNNEISLHAY